MSGEVACCSVVCGTLVGVSVFSIMCSELLIMCDTFTPPVSIESGILVTCRMQYAMYVSTVLLLLFATTRSVFKSVKVSVVEIAKRTN